MKIINLPLEWGKSRIIYIIMVVLSSTNTFAQYSKLLDFGSVDNGTYPYSTPISDGTFLYGMTSDGGVNHLGTVYKVKPDGSSFTKLLDFDGTNGSNPYGSLIFDGTFLYGMTRGGGANSQGTIFKIMPDGTGYTDLFDFNYIGTGAYPYGSLIYDGTFLYGMTSQGGSKFYGTIFKIMPNGTGYTKLLEFDYTNNGGYPYGSLFSDGAFLYAMAKDGGLNDFGTLIKIKTDGTGFIKLLDFNSSSSGSNPYGSLISDGTFLYGMTLLGGLNNHGNLFKIKPDGTGFAKLIDFNRTSTGAYPKGSLVSDGAFLYGMTSQGGSNSQGTIFKIKPDGTGFVKLLDADGNSAGPPAEGTLLIDGASLYGTKSGGGLGNLGAVFKINNDGSGYSKLINFEISGNNASGSLFSEGTYLYGMTSQGGSNNFGTIFKIKPDGTNFTRLLDFNGTSNGNRPNGTLISDGTFLYGMTSQGGLNDAGTVFKIKSDGTGFTTLLSFDGTNGFGPNGSLIYDGTFLYGMTAHSGTNSNGTIFKIKPDGTGFINVLEFDYLTNGAYPNGSLISDGTFLYGTTYQGGANGGWGTVFKIKSDGTGFAKLHDFDYTNGSNPLGSLISDGTFLYGMTSDGSNKNGSIFKIKSDGTGFATLLEFDGTNGSSPHGSLISDGTFLYGMTTNGGQLGLGTIFKIKPDGSSYAKLKDFNDGSYPQGSLISDGTFLYGMTLLGGSNDLGTLFKRSLAPATTITNFIPEEGVEGTLITIYGTDFNPIPANNIVKFNNTLAIVKSSTETTLNVIVPAGATTGPISVTSFGTGTSSSDFIVTTKAVMVNVNVQNCNVQFLAPTYQYIQDNNYNDVIETFLPVNPTDKVKVSFSSFSVGDFLYVYDGPTKASPLIATLSGNTLPTDIIATGTGGELTFLFNWIDNTSDWEATISCVSTSPSITITTQPTFTYACEGSTAIFSVTASGATNLTYRWQTFNGTDFTDMNDGSGYTGTSTKTLSINTSLTGFNANGEYRCRINGDLATEVISEVARLTINGVPDPPDVTGDTKCVSPSSATLSATGGSDGSYNWYDVATGGSVLGVNGIFTTPSISAITTYYVSIEDTFCESIRVPVIATILSAPAKPTITANEPVTGGIVSLCLKAITLTAPPGFTYTWSSGETTQQISNVQPGKYSVLVNNAGCASVSSDVIEVVVNTSCVNNPPVISTTSVITTIGGFVSIDLSPMLSDPDNNLDLSSLQVVGSGTLKGGKTSFNGLNLVIDYSGLQFAGADEVIIRVCDFLNVCSDQKLKIDVIGNINVFNGISPNGDGKNDTWIIEYIDLFPDTQQNQVTLYNRWGDVVWEALNYNNSSVVFTGLNKNGSELTTGTYFYKIEFEGGRESITGYLSLKRE